MYKERQNSKDTELEKDGKISKFDNENEFKLCKMTRKRIKMSKVYILTTQKYCEICEYSVKSIYKFGGSVNRIGTSVFAVAMSVAAADT